MFHLTCYIIWKKLPLQRGDVCGQIPDEGGEILHTYDVQKIVLWALII